MRRALLTFVLLAGSCSSAPTASLLCAACISDADCGGNPCYQDLSGGHFCGAPCGGCPDGFSCQPVSSTSGKVVQTCFPADARCAGKQPVAAGDLGTTTSTPDGALPSGDLAVSCATPSGGAVSIGGGTVDRLFFGYTGDTRPQSPGPSYPSGLQMVINNIYTQMGTRGVQFALDGGDHMEASNASEAAAHMANYASAAALLGKPVFMTMGNHECATAFDARDCSYAGATDNDFKLSAYLSTLQKVSGATKPYYRFDVTTATGKAVFLVVADDAWDPAQQSWLTTQLTDADAHAKYTFVTKHHPYGNTDQPTFQAIYDLVTAHKYTLFLTAHSHEYKHPAADRRAVVMGLGGAPFDNPQQAWWGYLTAMQCSDDHIYVSVYDQATGNVEDSFNVPPQ
jgi:hypothetical protein